MRGHPSARGLAALVALVVMASACAPSTPDEDSWRGAARRAISDVSSAVQTSRLALREDQGGHLYASYVQTVTVDAEELAGTSAASLSSIQPPEVERQRYDAVTAQLDDAASLLSEVRIAVVAGHTGSYPDLVRKLADAAAGLDKLDEDLTHPPTGAGPS